MASVTYVGRRSLAGDVLGPNLISNGHFTSGTTGWTAGASTLTTTADGRLRITDATTGVAICIARQAVVTVSGALYRVDVDFIRGTSAAGLVYVFGASSSTPVGFKSGMATGAHSFYFVADAASTTIQLYASTGSATTGQYNDWDNVKVRAVQVRGHATDIEHVTGGEFNYNYSTWTKGPGWTISGGAASSDGTQTAVSNISQQTSGPGVLYGKSYATSFTVSGYSAGNVKMVLGANGGGASRASNAAFTETITATTTGAATHVPGIFVQASADFVGSIDNVSVKLAANNTWTLDFSLDANGLTPGRIEDVRQRATMNGTVDTVFNSSKRTLSCTTTRLAYGTWQFFEEFADNARDGQTITFDPYGTEDEPVAPGSYVLTNWSLARVFGAQTTEERQYTFTVREA